MKYHDFAEWCIRCHFKARFEDMGVGLDSHGVIDEDEVTDCLRQACSTKGCSCGTLNPAGEEVVQCDECKGREVLELFMYWDLDNTGGVEEVAFSSLIMKLNPVAVDPNQVKHLFYAADANKDGKIDYREFLAWVFKK